MPPELQFEQLAFRVYRGPVLTADGTAQRASLRRDTADLAAEGVVVRFPATETQDESRVWAARGMGNLRARRFTAQGGVRGEQRRQVATTDQASYSAEDGLVRGDRPIVVRGGDFTASGPGFTLDPRTSAMRIENGARVVSGDRRR